MKGLLLDRRLAGLEPGGSEWFEAQAEIIASRLLTRAAYDAWYNAMLGDANTGPRNLPVLELGSGSCYVKRLDPTVITSDVIKGPADLVIDGTSLPFPSGGLRAILLTHVFHHIPDVSAFLSEAVRALAVNGVISMVDVAHTPFARMFFSTLHPEPYISKAENWKLEASGSNMAANQALSWIVFRRDRRKFEETFPNLRIERMTLLPWLGYLLSGGVTRRSLVPASLAKLVQGGEKVLTWSHPIFSLHWHITVRKVG